MNKKIVALAIAGALSAPMIAQAQTGSVVMYGSVRGALISTKTSGGDAATAFDSISSRWGVRASESFGGMTGFAHLEMGYAADTVGASFGVRESWVGLSGGFGEVKLGAGLNVYDDVMGMNHNSVVGGFNNINAFYFGNGFTNYNTCVGTAADGRYGNSIRYASPKLGPVQYRSHYSIGNEAAVGRNCSAFDNALIGGFGPVQFGVVYSQHNNFQATAGVLQHDADILSGTVKGSFGIIDANLGLESGKYKADWNTSSGKYRAMTFGIGANFGPTKVGIDYSDRNNGIGASGTGLHNARVVENANGGGKLATLYVNHNLSKRTIGYVWFGQNKPETGAKQTQMAVALRHNY